MYKRAQYKELETFEKQQEAYAAIVKPLLTPDINPMESDEDFDYLRGKAAGADGNDSVVIAESVMNDKVQGDERDTRLLYASIHEAIKMHREVYFDDPTQEQMAAIGGVISNFPKFWEEQGREKSEKIIQEALEYVGTESSVISVIPQFMTIATLIPLLSISYQFCHSLGTKPTDKLTVYELDELVGSNPYGITEGTSINGLYDGEMSNTCRISDSAETANGTDVVTFTATLTYPIVAGKVRLVVNKRPIAIDNGSGVFNLSGDGTIDDSGTQVTIASSSVTYWDNTNAIISVTFGAAIPAGLKVWFIHDTDVEGYPDYVSETKYSTRSFDLFSSSNIIRTGVTLQSVLKSMRNMKLHLKDIAFSRLLAIVVADIDREVLRRINRMATGTKTFDKKLSTLTHSDEQTQWARIREQMLEGDEEVRARTDGKGAMHSWLVDDNLKLHFLKTGKRYFKKSPNADNPKLANQPHFLGEFDDKHRIFYNPGNAANTGTGIARGDKISNCAAVLGTVTPPMPHQHGETGDLAKRCTLYSENFADQPPEAYKYVYELLLTDTT